MQRERLRHMIVIVPGIGGSVLEDAAGTVVWGTRRGVAGTIVDPARISIAEAPGLVPVALLPTMRVVPGFFAVAGYDTLVRQIENTFEGSAGGPVRVDVARADRDPDYGADVVLFPYDFRLGIADAAAKLGTEVERRLSGLTEDARRSRLIVVGHSMGGLVARYWLGGLCESAQPRPGDCAALITVGAPHRGAPKALHWLVNGIRVGPRTMKRTTAVLREWPSAYELLPRYRAVTTGPPGSDGTWLVRYPHELAGVGEPGFADRARDAFGVHEAIETAWRAGRPVPAVLPLFARGHRTLERAELAGTGLAVAKVGAEWLPNRGWAGDGTVPAISAIPIELDGKPEMWRPVTERHLPMAGTPAVIDILRNYSGEPLEAVRGEMPDRPWLGVDVEEMYPAGEPVRVVAELLGVDAGADTELWARVRPAGSLRWTDHPAERAGAGWVAEIPALPPGEYQVRVDANGVPVVGTVATSPDVFAVVGP